MRYTGNVYKILVGKPERKRSLGRLRHRLEGDIIMTQKGIGLGCGLDSCASGTGASDRLLWRGISRPTEWILATQEGLCWVGFVMNGNIRWMVYWIAWKCNGIPSLIRNMYSKLN